MPSPFKLQTRDADRFTNPGGHNQPILIGIELIENPNSANGKGVINGKAGKAAALPKFSDTLTLSQSGGVGRWPFALPCLNNFPDYAPA